MIRTTVVASEETLLRMRILAKKAKVPLSEIVRRALNDFAARHAGNSIPSFVGIGRSRGRGRLSEDHEGILFERR